MNRRDQELAEQLAKTLDHSVDSLDLSIRRQLNQARQKALASERRQQVWHKVIGVAMAAVIAGIVILPWPAQQHDTSLATKNIAAPAPTEDPEMLKDMDMLDAIGEEPNAT